MKISSQSEHRDDSFNSVNSYSGYLLCRAAIGSVGVLCRLFIHSSIGFQVSPVVFSQDVLHGFRLG